MSREVVERAGHPASILRRQELIVIGGGAAGIFCAINAARLKPSLRVTVLEKTGKLLSKVRVSGGGRCNVTHGCYEITEMMKRYPRGGQFVRKAFHQFFTTDTIQWFGDRGVALKTEADGRMFPVTDSSETIIECLMKEVNRYGIEVRMHAEVKRVLPALGAGAGRDAGDTGVMPGDAGAGPVGDGDAGDTEVMAGDGDPGRDVGGDLGATLGDGGDAKAMPAVGDTGNGRAMPAGFRVELANGVVLEADHVCIACGGYPKSTMFDWIRALGHTVEEPVPSLFTFNMPGHPVTALMGVSVAAAQVRVAGAKLLEKGPLLITHWGMSGPAVLRLSAWGARDLAAAGYTFTVLVNWVPELSEQAIREKLQQVRFDWAAQKVGTRNPFGLPQRLWEYWLGALGVDPALRWADLPAREQNRLVKEVSAGEFPVKGKTTFKEEFVTAGGVRLAEVDPATMQSRKVPGLFFAGEILDVDGVTGGFNFQHAWTSGFIAARTIAAGAIPAGAIPAGTIAGG